jgi:UDP-3-O-acyl-N-acetylglucosamine deacetylase
VIGHLVAHRAGHALHTAFAARILEQEDAWTIIEGEETRIAPVPVPVVSAKTAARLAN